MQSVPRVESIHESIFLSSPGEVQDSNEIFTRTNETSEPLYPNCQGSIWLRSCEEEVVKPLEGVITGTIPHWLCGSLIRNGPGSIKVGDEEFDHLFDGSALLHRFWINSGHVTYQCRFLQSDVYKKNLSANRIVIAEFGTRKAPDPCCSIFNRIATIFTNEMSDNSMISVYPFCDELYAFGETPVIHRINSETLDTTNRVNIADHISIVSHTSHPHVSKNGSVFNLGVTAHLTGPRHIIAHFPTTENGGAKSMFENAEIVASIPARWPLNPSYMHTFGLTDNYYIIVEQPLNVSLPSLVVGKFKNEPVVECLRWHENEHTQINVVSRKSGKLCYKFFSNAFFYLHIINQYEEDSHIVLDICVYRDASVLNCMYLEAIKGMQHNPNYAEMFRSKPARFVLPLKENSGKGALQENLVQLKNTGAEANYLPNGEILVVPEKLCDLGCETPRINYESHLGKPYRYFYAIGSDVDAEKPGSLIKVDTRAKTAQTWWQENCYPGEPIFVPNPDSKYEDDGILLSVMVWGGDEENNHVGLLILNAETFAEIGRASFVTPGPVPKCLHGWFLPDK